MSDRIPHRDGGTGQAKRFGDAVPDHFIGDRADPPQAAVAPVTLHVCLCRIAHATQYLDAHIGGLVGVFGREQLEHIGLIADIFAACLSVRAEMEQQLGCLLHRGDVSDVVLID